MKRISGLVLAGIGVMLAGSIGDVVWAQGGMRTAPATGRGAAVIGADGGAAPVLDAKKILAIRHMPRLNKVKQPTPTFISTSNKTSTGRPRDWALFEVTYDTIPEWVDELVVTYYVVAERRSGEVKKEYSFYQTTVRYVDIARGEHTACAVLSPATLLRYGDQIIGFAVEFTSADGTLLAAKDEKEGTVLPPDWWKKPEVTESKSVVKRDGLTDRSKTPFALVNMDDYEVVK